MKALLTVDLQEEFESCTKFWDYYHIRTFAEQYDVIYCLYDESSGIEKDKKPLFPDVFHKKAKRIVMKMYGTYMGYGLLDPEYQLVGNGTFIEDENEKVKFLDSRNPLDAFGVYYTDRPGFSLALCVDSLHRFTEINPKLLNFYLHLPEEIDIIGGAWKECLHDVTNSLRYLGKNPTLKEEFIF